MGFNLIFISPMAPFIPLSSKNAFRNKSSYSDNNMCTSFIVFSSHYSLIEAILGFSAQPILHFHNVIG
jgi:hypothetical protein